MGVDVDTVVALDRDRRLELARQVLLFVEGFRFRLGRLHDLPVEPDLVICRGARRELGDHSRDRVLKVRMKVVGKGFGAAHDVALDIAAAAERRQKGVVDGADRFLDVALEHSVQLEVLPGGDAHRAVCPAPADVVMRDVRIGRDDAPGDPRTDHQLVMLVQPAGPRLLAAVAIILLVDAVKLEQLFRSLSERGRVLEQLLFDEPSKVVARRLDGLIARKALEGRAVGKVRQLDAPPLM